MAGNNGILVINVQNVNGSDMFEVPDQTGFHFEEWLGTQLAHHILKHPFRFARVLIRAGHEPLPPQAMWGKPWLIFYPNILKYVSYLYKADGFMGLYRGCAQDMLRSFVETFVREELYVRLAIPGPGPDVERQRRWTVQVILEGAARGMSVVLSQPFYVFTVRSMLQFVGKETVYSSIWSAAREIYNSQGLTGFFAGLAPRLLVELAPFLIIVVLRKITYGFSPSAKYVFYTRDSFTDLYDTVRLFRIIAQCLFSPLFYMSTVMAACGCGLKAGHLPNITQCHSFRACLLESIPMKKFLAGATMFWRY